MPIIRDQRFGPTPKSFADDGRTGKQVGDLRGRQQPHVSEEVFKVEMPPIRTGLCGQRPDSKPWHYNSLQRFWQPMDEWGEEVLLDRKPAIRRLNPIRPADARDLLREAGLAGRV